MNPRLDSLKRSLQTATDLSLVLGEFLDLVESPGFLKLGRPRPAAELDDTLRRLIREKAEPLLVVRLEDEGFNHGSFHVGRRLGVLFSFDDLGMGLVALSRGKSGWTDLYRFSVAPCPGS